MVRDPHVFLLDEPLSNLDAKLRTSARDELKRFQQRVGTTTIYVTHDQAEAMGLGDRIAVMDHGRVRQLGPPVEVYDDPADTFVATFIGSPPMNLVPATAASSGSAPSTCCRPSTSEGPSERWCRSRWTDRVPLRRPARVRHGHAHRRGDPGHRPAAGHGHDPDRGRGDEFAVHPDRLRFFDAESGHRADPVPVGG